MTDETIIDMYFARNEEAIRESDVKYGAYCLAVADNILADREDAKECINDTWLSAWKSIPPTRPSSLKLFFARITRNLAYNRHRANTAVKRGSGELAAVLDELEECIDGDSVERHIESAEMTRSINAFLASLDSRERCIFVRRYFFVESTAVIAKRFALSNGNVLTVLSRTRKKLKKHLSEEGYSI